MRSPHASRFLVMVAPPATTPPPPAKTCNGPHSLSRPPTKSMPTCGPTPPTQIPALTRYLIIFLGMIERHEVPAHGLFLGGGWRAIWGWPWKTSHMMFQPPPPQPWALAGPRRCTHHPTFVTRCAAGLHPVPVEVRGGCSSCGAPTSWSWRRTSGWMAMPPCTGQSVGSFCRNGLRRPSSRRTTRRRSALPSRRRKGVGQFDVHANVRYANTMLATKPRKSRDCALHAHCIVRSLRLPVCEFWRDFRQIFLYRHSFCSSTGAVFV